MHRILTLAVAGLLVLPVALAQARQPRDLSKLRACEVVTGKDVASLANGKLTSTPLGSASGSVCSYLIELSNGEVEGYGLSFQPAANIDALFKTKSPADKGERVQDLWDDAYLLSITY